MALGKSDPVPELQPFRCWRQERKELRDLAGGLV
jgi:hypothetical protein